MLLYEKKVVESFEIKFLIMFLPFGVSFNLCATCCIDSCRACSSHQRCRGGPFSPEEIKVVARG